MSRPGASPVCNHLVLLHVIHKIPKKSITRDQRIENMKLFTFPIHLVQFLLRLPPSKTRSEAVKRSLRRDFDETKHYFLPASVIYSQVKTVPSCEVCQCYVSAFRQ